MDHLWTLKFDHPSHRLVLFAVRDLTGILGPKPVAQRDLSEMTGLSIRTVGTALIALEERGYIRRRRNSAPKQRLADTIELTRIARAPDVPMPDQSGANGNDCGGIELAWIIEDILRDSLVSEIIASEPALDATAINTFPMAEQPATVVPKDVGTSGPVVPVEFEFEPFPMPERVIQRAAVVTRPDITSSLGKPGPMLGSYHDATIADAFDKKVAPGFWTSPVPPAWDKISTETFATAIKRIAHRVSKRDDAKPVYSRAYIDAALKGELGSAYPRQ